MMLDEDSSVTQKEKGRPGLSNIKNGNLLG